MDNEFVKQHIVPQAYLARFTFEQNGKHFIGTRFIPKNKKAPSLFPTNINNVGYIKNYYDVLQKYDKKYWEHFFNKFEGLCGVPLENIISVITLSPTGLNVITPESKSILSRIIMSQAIRVPAFLDEEIKTTESFIDSYKKDFVKNNQNLPVDVLKHIENLSFDDNRRKGIILDGVFDEKRFDNYCRILEQKVWMVFYNTIRRTTPFVTGDNPVLFSHLKGMPTKMVKIGIKSNGLVILYPITPSILVGLYPQNAFLGMLKEYDGNRINIDDQNFIIKTNTNIIAQCYNHSFLPEPLFSLMYKQ